jgi:Eco29kI restriction endonuclease
MFLAEANAGSSTILVDEFDACLFEGAAHIFKCTRTPIYVGKADPANDDASTTREQGAKLTGRLIEHAGTVATAEGYSSSLPAGLSPIRLADFMCRRLVCATNAQLVAEKHLIRTFWPVWNSETRAFWGMSKHKLWVSTRRIE